jgi:hypothetical protein
MGNNSYFSSLLASFFLRKRKKDSLVFRWSVWLGGNERKGRGRTILNFNCLIFLEVRVGEGKGGEQTQSWSSFSSPPKSGVIWTEDNVLNFDLNVLLM